MSAIIGIVLFFAVTWLCAWVDCSGREMDCADHYFIGATVGGMAIFLILT